ncbi:hypothetical protein SLE2022_127390 [Rubroshorea leprosula]
MGHTFSQKYHNRVIQHEAGHFLIAYLVGILPKGYTLTSLETSKNSINVQAGTASVDFEFLGEVTTGKVSAMLNRFSCIALAGVATEYLLYGYAEGGLADINKIQKFLPKMFMYQHSLCKVHTEESRFPSKMVCTEHTVLLLRPHETARAKLADAMSLGKSVGSCLDFIVDNIEDADI